MFKLFKKRWVRSLLLLALFSGLIFSGGCGKLQAALEKAIDQVSSGKAIDLSGLTGGSTNILITGKVMSKSGTSSSAVSYALVKVKVGTNSEISGYTDQTGYYKIGLSSLSNANQIVITVTSDGYYDATDTLTVGSDFSSSDKTIFVSDIYLAVSSEENTKMGGITGTCRFKAVPLAGVAIKISSTTSDVSKNVLTDPNGFFAISGLTDGTYTVSASKEGFAITGNSQTKTVSIASGKWSDKITFLFYPTSTELKAKYQDIDNLGVINAGFIQPGQTKFQAMPSFVANAKVTIKSIQDDKGNNPTTFCDRSDCSFVFYGIPVSTNVQIELELESNSKMSTPKPSGLLYRVKKLFTKTAAPAIQTHTYIVKSEKLSASGDLPATQNITINQDDYIFQTGVWIEKEVRVNLGNMDMPVQDAKVVFTKGDQIIDIATNETGWFGLTLDPGTWKIEIYYPKTAPNPVFTKDDIVINQNMFDPTAWFPGFLFVQGVKVDTSKAQTKHIEFELKQDTATNFNAYNNVNNNLGMNNGVINYNNNNNNYVNVAGVTYSNPITFVLYSVNNREYRVTASPTVTPGRYGADIAMLGEFRAEIVSGDVKLRDPLSSYFVDQYSPAFNTIFVREDYFEADLRVYCQLGSQEMGVPLATVRLLRDGVQMATFTTTQASVVNNFNDWSIGSVHIKIKDTPLLTSGEWQLEIKRDGYIKKKTLAIAFERDNSGTLLSNLSNLKQVKTTMTGYFGARFPKVSGRLGANISANVANASVTLRYIGTTLTVTGTTDGTGEFTITNVPAIDQELEMIVTKNGVSSIGKSMTFRFSWNDINGVSQLTEDDIVYIPWGQSSNNLWVEFNGFILGDFNANFTYNNREFRIPGASIKFTKVGDTSVSANAIADDSGNFKQVMIPEDGSYNVVVTANGFTDKTYSNQTLGKTQPMNFGWDKCSITMSKLAGTSVVSLIPTVNITGYVYKDTSGTKSGLNGATVSFKPKGESDVFTASTDSDGAYSVDIPKVDEYSVTASLTGYAPTNRSEWINDWSKSQLNEFTMRVEGATGWWDVNEFDFKSAKIIENGFGDNIANTSTKTIYGFKVKINKDGTAYEAAQAAYKIVLVDATTGEWIMDLEPIGAGYWTLKNATTSDILGMKAIETTFSASRVRIEVKNSNGYTIYPADTWQTTNAEKDVPGVMEPPATVVASAESYTFNDVTSTYTKFTIDNAYWSNLGLSGTHHRIKIVKSDDSTKVLIKDLWTDAWAASNSTIAWEVQGWDWVDKGSNTWGDIRTAYPDNLPTGTYRVTITTASDLWNATKIGVITGTITNPKYRN